MSLKHLTRILNKLPVKPANKAGQQDGALTVEPTSPPFVAEIRVPLALNFLVCERRKLDTAGEGVAANVDSNRWLEVEEDSFLGEGGKEEDEEEGEEEGEKEEEEEEEEEEDF